MGGVISSPIKSVLSAVSGSKPSAPAAAAPQVDAPKPQPLSSPTQAEVEQGETSRLLKAKRKGRSMTILTSPSGVSDQTTLSTKTLLGA
jgi:hypothetical protein